MSLKSNLNALLLSSSHVADSFVFPQEIPNSPNPLSLCKWYANEIKTVTEQIDILEQAHNTFTTCSKGCAACCHQLIAITYLEHLIIEFTLNNLPLDERTRIKETVYDQCNFLNNHGYSQNSLSSLFISPEKYNKMQEEYFSFGLPCPLLTQNKTCSIYSLRPTLCWSYRNYGNTIQCTQTWEVPTTLKYDDWESKVAKRFYQIKRPSRKYTLMILQFALLTMLSQKRF